MRIILKGFSDKSETISSNYRINSEKLNWSVSGFSESKKGRDRELLKSLWNLYQIDETAWAVVQAISTISLGEEFKIEGIDKNSSEFEDLTRAFTRTWTSMYDIVRDTLIFGNSFAKIINNRTGKFLNLIPLFPLDVTKEELKDGSFQYTYGNNTYTEDEMFENQFFNRPDSVYGFSLLGASKNAIDRKRIIESNIATAISRHMPRFHIQTSPDTMGRYPSEDEREDIGKEFKKLASDNEFVSTDLININVLDTKSTIPELENYMMWSLNSILIGAGTPAEIIGAITKSGSYATSKARSNVWLTFTIKYYQKTLQNAINNQILKGSKAKLIILPPSELVLPYSK